MSLIDLLPSAVALSLKASKVSSSLLVLRDVFFVQVLKKNRGHLVSYYLPVSLGLQSLCGKNNSKKGL